MHKDVTRLDQLIVRVGKWCNFRCNFCNVSDNEKIVKLKESAHDIVRNFLYKFKFSVLSEGDSIMITISGGEPSIFQKETIFAITYIKRFLEKRQITPIFDIQTNAANIDRVFAKKIADLWIQTALVSFHTNDKEIFDPLIGVSYETFFPKIIEGMKYLHEVWIEVECNTVLSKMNVGNFYDTIVFLEETLPFIQTFCIWFFQPHWDAGKNFDDLFIQYHEVEEEYNRAISYIWSKWKKVLSHFVGLPACYISDFDASLEIKENIDFRKRSKFDDRHLISHINDSNKEQTADCDRCMYNNICSGIWKEYVGKQKLRPVPYQVGIQWEFSKWWATYKLQNISESLEEIHNTWVFQLIVCSSLWSKDELYSVFKEATELGFSKITLFIDSDFDLEDKILYTWISNIQAKLQDISLEFIEKCISFSDTYFPQFRIDLDIFLPKGMNIPDNLQHISESRFCKFYN